MVCRRDPIYPFFFLLSTAAERFMYFIGPLLFTTNNIDGIQFRDRYITHSCYRICALFIGSLQILFTPIRCLLRPHACFSRTVVPWLGMFFPYSPLIRVLHDLESTLPLQIQQWGEKWWSFENFTGCTRLTTLCTEVVVDQNSNQPNGDS